MAYREGPACYSFTAHPSALRSRHGRASGSEFDGRKPVLSPTIGLLGVQFVNVCRHLWAAEFQYISSHA
jgi:hypothetical protein